MNMADAIRKATQLPAAIAPTATARVVRLEEPVEFPTPTEKFVAPTEPKISNPEPKMEQTSVFGSPGGLVKVELYLTPDQLSSLFKAVAAQQHSVLTLKEAATYLRIAASHLESLAQEGEIPGMLVDGRWRFTKQAIDEWFQANQNRRESA